MPTRTIILKMVIPRAATSDATLTRQALWRTHQEINAATAHYEHHLLLLRGRPYQTTEAMINESDARDAVVAYARRVQKETLARDSAVVTPTSGLGNDDEIVAILGRLYAAIVPSVMGEDGSAQAANAHLSPLTDPASEGFMEASRKLDRPRPNWLEFFTDDPDAVLEAANAWFASAASAEWRSDTGSPANWLRKARLGDAAWPLLFSKKLTELREAIRNGIPGLFRALRALHLLPLFPACFSGRIVGTDAAVTPWDRLAFRLAVAHLLSWESWSRRAADEHGRRNAILAKFRADHLTENVAAGIEALRGFERGRDAHRSTLGLRGSNYRLMRRQLRNWPDLRKQWLNSGSVDPTTLMEIARIEQDRLRGRFGDPAVFGWLAASHNQHVWRSDPDTVSLLVSLNAMETLVSRSRETALMTFPDPVAHPRAVQWSAVGDGNLRPYRISVNERGECVTQLRLLVPRDGDDRLLDQERVLKLAPSEQFTEPVFSMRDKKAAVTFRTAGVDSLSGVIGSADLLLNRHHLEGRPADALAAGDIGSARLKLSLDLDPIPREGWSKDAAKFVNHFHSAAGKTTEYEARVSCGNRALSVDLGFGTFAACSVFSLADSKPAGGRFALSVDVGGRSFWAVHERSFHLTLRDETTDGTGLLWRREQEERLRRLRRALTCYRRARRLVRLAGDERSRALTELQVALADGDPFPFEAGMLARLQNHTSVPDSIWSKCVEAELAGFRIEMGSVIKAWRRQGRARASDRRSGPSMWAIRHLSDIRRLLVGWSLMERRGGDVRRLDRTARGIFASRLLGHIDALKENRLKTGADMIVQAARGYQRDHSGCWRHAHPACDVVLFEDLSRYHMIDRVRREDLQLMLWARRAIPIEVAMQGELYGLAVADTSAAFASRYHARVMAPGIRCRALTRSDFSNACLCERLAGEGIAIEKLSPGSLVPWDSGDTLVCPREGGGLWRIDADINAVQNLQRRFWTRHADAFRISCLVGEIAGEKVFVPRGFGQRLLGAMGGYGVLMTLSKGSPACRWRPMKRAEYRKLDRSDVAGPGDDWGDNAESVELRGLTDEVLQLSGQIVVFFRDPSGVVFQSDLWYPQKVFWGLVKTRVTAIQTRLASDAFSDNLRVRGCLNSAPK